MPAEEHATPLDTLEPVPTSVHETLVTPYVETSFRVKTDRPIHELTTTELATVVSRIVKGEGPIHQDEITRGVASLWGCKRTGSRIVDAVDRALADAAYNQVIEQSGPFFKSFGQLSMPIRDRSNVASANLLKPEYLPPDEIRAATLELVRAHFGMTQEEAVGEVIRILGFRRTGAQLRQIIVDEIRLMVSEQLLVCRNDKFYCVTAENGQSNESLFVG
jgi:hypothetical protein